MAEVLWENQCHKPTMTGDYGLNMFRPIELSLMKKYVYIYILGMVYHEFIPILFIINHPHYGLLYFSRTL